MTNRTLQLQITAPNTTARTVKFQFPSIGVNPRAANPTAIEALGRQLVREIANPTYRYEITLDGIALIVETPAGTGRLDALPLNEAAARAAVDALNQERVDELGHSEELTQHGS